MHLILTVLLLVQLPHETNPAKIVADNGIRLYQIIISPAQGSVCNFSPSCSRFAKQAIEEHGIIWGSLMASDRLLRCNPWAFGLHDTYYEGIKDFRIHDPVKNNYILGRIKKDRNKSFE